MSTCAWRSARAALTPPKPPPTITTRWRAPADWVALELTSGRLPSPPCGSARDEVEHLRQPDRIARRVAEAGVDPVRALLGRLGEFDAAIAQLLVRRAAVLGRQEHGAGHPLGHQVADLLAGLGIDHRRARDRHQDDRDVGLAGRADRQPAEVPHLAQGDVLAHLEADLPGPELERRLLVVDPELGAGKLVRHVSP